MIGGFSAACYHYQFGAEHMKTTKGYEYYAKMTDKIHTYGDDKVIDFFVDLSVGHPRAVLRQDPRRAPARGNDHFVGVSPMQACPAAEPSATCASSPRTSCPRSSGSSTSPLRVPSA